MVIRGRTGSPLNQWPHGMQLYLQSRVSMHSMGSGSKIKVSNGIKTI